MSRTVRTGRKRFAIAVSCCLVALNARASQPFWLNGTFLRPSPHAGGFALLETGLRFGDWRVVGAIGDVTIVSGSYTHNGFSFPAQTGAAANWANLAGFSGTATGIAHSAVPTIPGQAYTLTYYVGNLVDPSGRYGTQSTVRVYENARLLATSQNTAGAGTTVENWKFFELHFTADAAWTIIAFINADPPGDLNCGISNITLAPDSPAARPRS